MVATHSLAPRWQRVLLRTHCHQTLPAHQYIPEALADLHHDSLHCGATSHTSNQHRHAVHLRNLWPRPQESTALPPRAPSLKEHQQSVFGGAEAFLHALLLPPLQAAQVGGAHCSVKWNRRPLDWDGQRPGPSLSAARKRGRRLPGASLLNPAAPSLKQI